VVAFFVLQRRKEDFGDRVVPAVAFATHARHKAKAGYRPPEVTTRVLAATVGVEQHTGLSRRPMPGFEEGVLDEQFTYSDGTREQRIWRLRHLGQGRYSGQAGDVVGTAQGQTRGNAFQWGYTLALPVDGRVWEVQFDDWMYLMDERVMLNKARMSKWGFHLGEVTLSFTKRATP